jgi:apolipoprotein N-acyltransferase
VEVRICSAPPAPNSPLAFAIALKRWRGAPVVAAAATGLLLAACYWPFDLHWLAWIALVPLALALPRMTPRAAWILGGLAGLVYYGIGLMWLPQVYGLLAGGLVIVLLSAWLAFSFRVASALVRRCGPSALLWALPLCFTAQECIRAEGLPLHRFAQLALGYSQFHNLWVAQIASLGGVYFVTFLVVAANAAVACFLMRPGLRSAAPLAAVALAVLTLGLASQPPDYGRLKAVPVAAVQQKSNDYRGLALLAREAVDGPGGAAYVVFPEHTLSPADAVEEAELPLIGELEALSAQTGSYFAIGAHTLPEVPGVARGKGRLQARESSSFPASWFAWAEPRCAFDNVNLLLGPLGIAGRQLKSVPMPFWPDGNPAAKQETFATPDGRIGLYVCYDEAFSDVMRGLAVKGAGLLLGNIYNGTQWPVQQRMQQAEMTAFRAIELRRCVVRSASSGVSQIIDATGRVQVQRLMSEGPGLLRGTVYFSYEPTFFLRGGFLFPTVVAGAFLLIAAFLLTASRWRRLGLWARLKP